MDPTSLGLRPHPEGGWYRETWRSPLGVQTPHGMRSLATAIVFLLQPGERSNWHRVASDEMWLWQGGGPMRLRLGGSGDAPAPDAGHVELGPAGQHVVPAGVWQSAEPSGPSTSVVGCVVSPGFDFADFELWAG